MTKLINILGGPGVGKTTIATLVFAELKLLGKNAEYVSEYAKQLVWTNDFELLNNQHHVTNHQVKLFKGMVGKVDYIITDGSILHGLYYNLHNEDNVSNIDKTEKYIIECYNSFNNVNIMLTRGNYDYETAGRIQSIDEAKHVDIVLPMLLKDNNIEFKEFVSSRNVVNEIINEILK